MSRTYRALRWGSHALLSRWCDLHVEGLHNVPTEGAFLLVPNHQSILDPFLVQGVCPRVVYSLTKSTQFASTPSRMVLLRAGAFPVRRYRIDPQSVRVALRYLDAGEAVCVYPEGERSWDGALQRFRRGTLRLLLHAGVPIVPVGIEGAWDVWPRWSSKPRWGLPVTLRFGTPMTPGPYREREAREARLPGFDEELREVLKELSGENRIRREGTLVEDPAEDVPAGHHG